ncbi:hypothetical protein D3C81_1558340 [compost metagenome]
MYELAAFDADHCPGPGTCRDDGRYIALGRVNDAKPPALTQMFGQLQFIAQQTQLALVAPQDEYAWVRTGIDMGQQLFRHSAKSQVLMTVVTDVVKDHQLAKKRIAHTNRIHPQPVFITRRVKYPVPGGGNGGFSERRGDRDALLGGHWIGDAVIHHPRAKPLVPTHGAIHRPANDFVFYANLRQPPGPGR